MSSEQALLVLVDSVPRSAPRTLLRGLVLASLFRGLARAKPTRSRARDGVEEGFKDVVYGEGKGLYKSKQDLSV